MTSMVTVTRIGSKGDGIAESEYGVHFIPRGLPGDVYRMTRDAQGQDQFELQTPAPHRRAPLCRVFGDCGGCIIQEADPQTYAAWKRGLVEAAVMPLGLAERVAPLIDAHGAGRRRVTFHVRRREGAIVIGFMRAKSHDLIALESCPLLVSRMTDAAKMLEPLARSVMKGEKPIDLAVTATPAGLDVDIRGHGPASPELRMRLTRDAEALDLARLSLHGDVIVERRAPHITIGQSRVLIPPGSFLQATEAGEHALQDCVMDRAGSATKIADLFSGIGTFALRLAERSAVHAVETDEAALQAFQRAVREAKGLKPVTSERRDLFRRPLVPQELNGYEAVVLDPPRAGAEAQMRMLATSRVPRVVSVSCHLGSFVRDAEILMAGGYRCVEITPIDQFRHSSHIELVGLFERPAVETKPKRRLLG